MTTPLIILGTGGNCIDILDAVKAQDATSVSYEVAGFLDDDPGMHKETICGCPVLGALDTTVACVLRFPDVMFVNGIGSPKSFMQKPALIESTGMAPGRFATIVHPKASVSPSATIGPGTVILANTTICARAVIGHHVMILPGCVIGHDCMIDDYSVVAAGTTLCGGTHLHSLCYVGAGSVILGGVTVSARSLVGAGSVVIRNVAAETVVCGNPARRLRDV